MNNHDPRRMVLSVRDNIGPMHIAGSAFGPIKVIELPSKKEDDRIALLEAQVLSLKAERDHEKALLDFVMSILDSAAAVWAEKPISIGVASPTPDVAMKTIPGNALGRNPAKVGLISTSAR